MIAQTVGRDGSIWLLGRLSSDAFLPNIGMTMQVRYRQDCCDIGFHDEEHSKWEAPQNGPSKFVEDERIVLWAFSIRANVARSSVRNSEPRPLRSPSYHDAASRASSSASGRTSSRGIYGLARRRC